MAGTELTLGVTLAVLGAGLLHAGWNALLKSAPGGDPLLDTATVVAGSGIWALVAIPAVGVPDAPSWIFMLVSVAIHWAYYITLAHAYRTGDLSFAYPLMRGTAPLIATLLSIVILREVQDYRYEEIGAALQMPLNTVKVYLHRGRRKLRERLQEVVRDVTP